MIGSYSFGQISVDGREYSSDILIFPDGHVDDEWWRLEGHTLRVADIDDLIESGPDIIVVGTGAYGVMHLDETVVEDLAKRGISVEAAKTKEAAERYNELIEQKKNVAGCFHLTC